MAEQKPRLSEDWLAVCIGLTIFVLSLGSLWGNDLLGWVVKTNVWTHAADILAPVSKQCSLSPLLSLLATYLFLLLLTGLGAFFLRVNVGKFALSFTVVFAISYLCWMAGSYAYIAATPDALKKFHIAWSLNLTAEAGFIIALLAGLIVGNFLPRLAHALQVAIRPEWYIKTGIILLGGYLVVQAAGQSDLLGKIMLRGLCAIIEAYLIYWAVVYYVARKYFKFPREWAVPLASGISICGVSAAIATGAAIKARPIVPIMVSSLVVIFAVVELLVLPFVAQHFLANQPMVAGAWMGLAVKSDGAAVASGAITDSLICAKMHYPPGWIMGTATTVKVFIDIFIGVWACLLAIIWCSKIEGKPGESMPLRHIWERFPKFVLGYMLTFLVVLVIAWQVPSLAKKGVAPSSPAAPVAATAPAPPAPAAAPAPSALEKAVGGPSSPNALRSIFFVMTFFTIGAMSNFKRLWQAGIARLAAVYVVCLFGFIIWVGLLISWLFFAGIKPMGG